ncbi:ankyrin repeat-containing domain protein [Trichoderma pleuroticola]
MSLSTGDRVRRLPSHVWDQHRSDIEQLYITDNCTLKEVMKAMEAKGLKASEQQYKIKFTEWQISKYRKRGVQKRADRGDPSTKITPFVDAPIGDMGFDPMMEYLSNMPYHPHTSEPLNLGIQQGEGSVALLMPRTASTKDRQPIHLAAQSGYLDMVKLLLEKDSTCASVPSSSGSTAIWLAAQQGHLEIVRLLVKCRGIDVNAATTDDMRTPIHQAAQNGHFDIAAQNGHVEVIKKLLEAGAQVDPHKDSYDDETPSPLWLAAQGGHCEVAELLIQKGADVNFSIHPSKRFAIHQAAQKGNAEVVRLLIKNGADVDAREEDGWPPLMIAAQENHIGIVNLLLEQNANVNAEEKDGATALWIASQQGHTQVIQKLIDRGAKSLAARSSLRRPIHQAAQNGHLEAVKLLLKLDSKDINIESETGATPLLLASQGETAGHLAVARYLIENDAAIVT